MVKEAIVQVRMDSELKQNAEKMFKQMGTSLAEAIRIFTTQSVEFGGIPFTVKAKNDNNKGLGIAKGKLTLPDDFDDYDADIENMFYGD